MTVVRLRSGCGRDPDRLAWMHPFGVATTAIEVIARKRASQAICRGQSWAALGFMASFLRHWIGARSLA